MRILGIDPSLTSTGCALVDPDDRLVVETWTVASRPPTHPITLSKRLRRLDSIADSILAVDDVGLVLIEAPAYDSRTGHQHERSGLWWRLVERFEVRGVHVAEITTGTVKKYATGKGNATKGAVIDAAARRFPHVETGGDDNQADGLWLAAMGYDIATGEALVPLPKGQRDAVLSLGDNLDRIRRHAGVAS